MGRVHTAFNPYLETDLKGTVPYAAEGNKVDSVFWTGVNSNCMSCHRCAARVEKGFNGPGYIPSGYISPSLEAFKGTVKTDFLWSVAIRANPNE